MGDFAFSIAGLFVGVIVGATGVGGGSLMTPLLILVFQTPASMAVGTDLLYAAITKAFGTWHHGKRGSVDWRVVGLLATGSLPATLLTLLALNWAGIDEDMERLMTMVLCITIGATAMLTLFRDRLRIAAEHESLQFVKTAHRLYRSQLTIASGVLLGVLVTLTSVGGGVIGTVILLVLYPRWPAIRIVGTDLAHAVPLTAVAGIGHYAMLGTVNVGMLGYLLLGSIPGIYIGTRLGFRLPDKALRGAIAVLLLFIVSSLFIKSAYAQLAG